MIATADRLRAGRLEIIFPDGTRHTAMGPAEGPSALMRINDMRVLRRYLAGGALGFSESYIDGDWDSPRLADLLDLLDRNADSWSDGYYGSFAGRLLARFQHRRNANTRRGAERNIHAHYDLGNDFFEAWLDPSMTYSAALFDDDAHDLEAAQMAKCRHLCDLLELRPGQHLLEIGSGWGNFAMLAAREFGAKVTSITISRAQHELASKRVFEAGLNEQVEIRYEDYRDVAGHYDRIASIEMFEAVGEAYWQGFFDKLRASLTPGGLAGLQVITIADQHFDSYRRASDFIQHYVFPGGMLPSPTVLRREAGKAGLEEVSSRAFGQHYARTLAMWHERFEAAFDNLREAGFDDRFRRIWRYYLAYCEAGFRTGSIDVEQLTFRPA